ncbi:hypothetical protein [Helicobacter pylori]|uniref:hypothetical protein n=1 Tax=Helicobacter pylori TaxID=210 RepID=UPI00026AB8B7|nr:hypothetical protein [Helicobacter pylori]EJB91980.1 hypothetical protein HPHPH18_0610 [Helicobacter pylori Hp H-18]
MPRENGANWKNSYAICLYKESKKPIPKNKKTEYLNKKEAKHILEKLKDNDVNNIIINQ